MSLSSYFNDDLLQLIFDYCVFEVHPLKKSFDKILKINDYVKHVVCYSFYFIENIQQFNKLMTIIIKIDGSFNQNINDKLFKNIVNLKHIEHIFIHKFTCLSFDVHLKIKNMNVIKNDYYIKYHDNDVITQITSNDEMKNNEFNINDVDDYMILIITDV